MTQLKSAIGTKNADFRKKVKKILLNIGSNGFRTIVTISEFRLASAWEQN
jgi:mRNA-degrading endonuclease HigB of HigAB toxin-antitoxin module